jgi:SAM-dependent methyltransferase
MIHSSNHFDERARTWDDDPVKHARALAVAEGIRGQVPLSPQMHALEYGCGTGLLGFALRPHLGRLTLADSSDGMLAVAREKIAHARVTNMRTLTLDLAVDPVPDERYDLICSLLTFHHVEDVADVLRKLFVLLASPGYLCVADLDLEDGSFHGPWFSGHKGFDRTELGSMAERAGFRNVRFNTVLHVQKDESAGQSSFPLFLMVAEK